MMKNSKTFFWAILVALVVGVVYTVNDILMPFIVSYVFAYFFVPIVNGLETRLGLPRTISALLVVGFIICMIVALWLVLGPLIFEQLKLFIQQIPKYKAYVISEIVPAVSNYIGILDTSYVDKVKSNMNEVFTSAFQYIGSFADHIWQSGMAFINIVSMLVLVPFITFYVIKDWRNISETVVTSVPVKTQGKFAMLLTRINTALSGFIRGQINVCIILAIYYSIALSLAGINYSVFLGIATGVLAFIPFVGFLTGFILSLLVAYFQFFAFNKLLLVLVVFVIGNLIENILSPKIVGNKIGLHPVWLIFALLVGANFFGFVGMLFAVPVAAVVNVLVKFVLELYYHSAFYLGATRKAKK